MHFLDLILRLSNHTILWIVSSRSRSRNREVFSLIYFVSSRYRSLPVLESMGSPCVAVGLLAYTFLREDAVGSSGSDESTQFLRQDLSSYQNQQNGAGESRNSETVD